LFHVKRKFSIVLGIWLKTSRYLFILIRDWYNLWSIWHVGILNLIIPNLTYNNSNLFIYCILLLDSSFIFYFFKKFICVQQKHFVLLQIELLESWELLSSRFRFCIENIYDIQVDLKVIFLPSSENVVFIHS
jgi:hypothetical protein